MSKRQIVKKIITCFEKGGKLLIFGNGGSAAMAQHMAAEFMCKFEHDRRPLPAIALTTDTSCLTAIANDYEFESVFARQVWALGKEEDIVIGLSTSGKSRNVISAYVRADKMYIDVIDFPRKGRTTAKIQEYQLHLMHDIVREVEKHFL